MNRSTGFQHADLIKVVIIKRTGRWKGNRKGIDETSLGTSGNSIFHFHGVGLGPLSKILAVGFASKFLESKSS